ncbi:MAG: tetratricopeptide repeat protein, partial [Deltaproteobacteria bacterium]|nr:tetratricopeptide repeat protein [Deltaproteobacteria bacterium]
MLNKINLSSQNKTIIIYVLLAVVTFTAYWQVNRYDFINLDDDVYVINNLHIQSGITLEEIRWAFNTTYADFWHPLTWLSLMLDYRFYGLHAGGYHVTNLILHIMSTLLLFWLFRRMTGAIWKSAFVAALFALHPFHAEAVVRISQRKEALCAFFWMLTLCLYVYYTEKQTIKRYLLVLCGFILALLSKPMAVTLPLILILLDYWPLGRFHAKKDHWVLRQLKEKMPLFFLSAVFSIITFSTHYKPTVKDFSLASRISNAFISLATYLEKTFWPSDVALIYPFPAQISLFQTLAATLLILLISAAVLIMAKRFPCLLVGWLWYLITLLPVIGIIKVGTHAMAGRYHYLPSVGIAIMLAWGIPFLFPGESMHRKIIFPAAALCLCTMALITWHQCGYWKNSITLFTHDLQVTKDNDIAHYNLACSLAEEGKLNEAIDHYSEAIRITPYYFAAYNNRGIAYAKRGQYKPAIESFSEAIRLKPD